MKIIRDTIHGDMQLTREEMRLVDTPEFQRMRGIRQLGTSHLVFPGAHHTRFEHSLGTCWNTRRMIAEINNRAERAGALPVVDADQARFLCIAALLHDITHIPFGHTFEDERRILPAHDKSRERLHYFMEQGSLGKVLGELGLRDQLITFFTKGKRQEPSYGYDLVAGPICADLLDYIRRDAVYCGLNLDYDDRLMRYLEVEGGRLCFNLYSDRGFRQDAWSELIHLLRIRYLLTERVYYHHTKMVTGAMLSRLLEALLAEDAIQIPELYRLRDDGFLYLLEQRIDKISSFKQLLHCFMSRRLYKRVYMVARDPLNLDFPDAETMARFQEDLHLNINGARAQLERKLAKKLRVPASAIIVYAPDTNMRLKEARVSVRMNPGPLVSLAEVQHPELQALDHRHQALWRLFVFMDPAYEDRFIKAGRFLEDEIGLPNQLELFNRGQMTFSFS